MRLSIPTLGTILRLADLVTAQNVRESEEDRGDCGQAIDRILATLTGKLAAPDAERDFELLLAALPHEELRDLDALYRSGRSEGDTFEFLRENPRDSLEMLPWKLSQRTDLHDSVVNGLKRLGESQEDTATEHNEGEAA